MKCAARSRLLGLIFNAEHDTTNRYQASKQADVLMLLYVFTADEFTALMQHPPRTPPNGVLILEELLPGVLTQGIHAAPQSPEDVAGRPRRASLCARWAADRRRRPLAFVLTPGQAADSPRFEAVLERVRVRRPVGRPRTRPEAVAADKAYSSRANRAYLRRRRIKAVIPEKADQIAHRRKRGSGGGRPVSFDAELYRERNTVERCINKIKAWRGLATRYDKTPDSYMAGLQLRGALIWLRSLQPTT